LGVGVYLKSVDQGVTTMPEPNETESNSLVDSTCVAKA
jgi:hypothetical protein